MGERPPVLIGEKVLWLGSGSGLPKGGKVKWIGRLAEMGPDWAVGLELDEALPYGGIDGTWGNRKLFTCRRKHGLIVPHGNVIPQPRHKPGEKLCGSESFGRSTRRLAKSRSQESKVGKLFRALSNDESSSTRKVEILELPTTHLRNPNLQRQLAILGTLRRSSLLESGLLEGVKSEDCLYSAILGKEENAFRERRRMMQGREFKRSDDTLERTSSAFLASSRQSRKDRSSGIFSIFRWFKREKSDDSEEDSPVSEGVSRLRRANDSISGSVDTLFSTATTRSFAFVSPSHYRPYGGANPPEIRICSGPDTNTYKNRIRQRELLRQQERNISLSEKYRLYASETLPRSVCQTDQVGGPISAASSGCKTSSIRRLKRPAPPPPALELNSSENSLPALLAIEEQDGKDIGRQHRRTLSEPSPTRYIKAFHVKGKRKAPPPPPPNNVLSSSSDRTLSLQRKKRRAPCPPIQRSPSDEIAGILHGTGSDMTGSESSLSHLETASTASTIDVGHADIVSTDTLRLERGYLRSNKDEPSLELSFTPTSPVSPRPWYKRNNATRENSFSRSNDRKREREKRRVEDWMIESGIPRRPNHLTDNRFNLFAKIDKTEEKRRSQISILTNISELDREAAEIVQKKKEKEQALLANQNSRFYDGDTGATSNRYFNADLPDLAASTTRESITVINSVTTVTNSTSFILQNGHFRKEEVHPAEAEIIHRIVLDEEARGAPIPIVTEPEPEPGSSGLGKIAKVTIEEMDDFDDERKSKISSSHPLRSQRQLVSTIRELPETTVSDKTPATVTLEPSLAPLAQAAMKKPLERSPITIPASVLKPVVNVIWNCPRCTLENPRWKITCDACDMWRPVPCEFKEVKPKHPLPLAVLRIVEPKDRISTEQQSANSGNITALSGNLPTSVSTESKDDKAKRYSQGLTISDLLFNTHTTKNDTRSEVAGELPSFKDRQKSDDSSKPELLTSPLHQARSEQLPVGSAVLCIKPHNPSLNDSRRPPTKVTVEPEEVRRARLAFFEKLKIPNTDQKLEKTEVVLPANKLPESVKVGQVTKVGVELAPAAPADAQVPFQDKHAVFGSRSNPVEITTHCTVQQKSVVPIDHSAQIVDGADKPVTSRTSPSLGSQAGNLSLDNSGGAPIAQEEIKAKETQTSVDPQKTKLSCDQEEDRRKLREMLKEMKHSLPKRHKERKTPQDVPSATHKTEEVKSESPKLGAIRKSITTKSHTPSCIKLNHEPARKSEVYLIESETTIEEIKVRKPSEKASSSAQTSAMVRQIVPQTKPPIGKEVIVPVTVEEHTIKNGVLYTSVSKKAKKIGTGAFQLMRPRDFANIEMIKSKASDAGALAAPLYANVLPTGLLESPASRSNNPAEVEKLSLKLIEPQGLANFRAGMVNNNIPNNVNTIAVNRLLRRLESAIANGQHELAAALAKELAQLKINCVVTRQKPEAHIKIDMYVEDKDNHQGPFPLRLQPFMTVEQLKVKVEREYEIPVNVQRWIIGKTLANDDKSSLESLGVSEPGSSIYLYLVVPEDQNNSDIGEDENTDDLEGAVGGVPLVTPNIKPGVVTQGTSNNAVSGSLEATNKSRCLDGHQETSKRDVEEVQKNLEKVAIEAVPLKLDSGREEWRCSQCTLLNSWEKTNCVACDYKPIAEVLTELTPRNSRLDSTTVVDGKANTDGSKADVEEKKLHYQKLVDLEKADLIICTETFECPICIVEYEPSDGVVLRECLHVFCRACLANTVEYSEEAEVKCPYRDNLYTCDSVLLEREIKALVTPEAYEQHLAKSIALAETKIGNAFHCKTPDCKGWCIFEDNVNLFKCPVCTHTNCLTCQAMHEGVDCKQFQEQLLEDSDINVDAKRTKDMLQEMVDKGEALNCPTCQVVLMKKWGCDWLRCSMCKTEICWITRGPRWGPNGKGDTTGGCQCGVNGVKCHPKCTYCH